MSGAVSAIRTNPYTSHIAPFFLFGLFTYLLPLMPIPDAFLYPLKTVLVGGALVFFWSSYKGEIRFSLDWPAIFGGIAVFLLWIGLEGLYPQVGTPTGFNPTELAAGQNVFWLVAFRCLGAILVVPIMEEIFWRSFALRFLMDTAYTNVPLGAFSWFSFALVSIAFGFEHHRWLPGILAGIVYAVLLYRSKNLFSPILSHAITNALLAGYVLASEQWIYW
jgi:hypothetical protein